MLRLGLTVRFTNFDPNISLDKPVQRGGSKKGYCSTAPSGMVVGPEKCSDHGDQSNKLRWNRDFSEICFSLGFVVCFLVFLLCMVWYGPEN